VSSDTEHQQAVLTLIDETEKASSETIKQTSETHRPRKNYCTEDYIVGYSASVLIVI
jgi:hypothetical protein